MLINQSVEELVRDQNSGLLYRKNPLSHDLLVIGWSREEYSNAISLCNLSEPTVLDLGAHIGSAAYQFLKQGAKKVICVEPAPDTFSVLEQNKTEKMELRHAAVGPPEIESLELYLHGKGYSDSHRTQKVLRRESVTVPSVSLGQLLEEYHPDFIKLDIEFGEYYLPELQVLPSYVRGLAIELHGPWGDSTSPKAQEGLSQMWSLAYSFLSQGFEKKHWKEKKAFSSVYGICGILAR